MHTYNAITLINMNSLNSTELANGLTGKDNNQVLISIITVIYKRSRT